MIEFILTRLDFLLSYMAGVVHGTTLVFTGKRSDAYFLGERKAHEIWVGSEYPVE